MVGGAAQPLRSAAPRTGNEGPSIALESTSTRDHRDLGGWLKARCRHSCRITARLQLVVCKRWVLVGGWGLVAACNRDRPAPLGEPQPLREPSAELQKRVEPPEHPCARRIGEVMQLPSLSGTPTLDNHRAEILARARSVPVVFLRPPFIGPKVSEQALRFRQQLVQSKEPAQTIFEIVRETSGQRELRREIFLSEQYFYADTPLLALRLSQILRLDHLFDEQELVIERGASEITVQRDEGRYWMPRSELSKEELTHGPPASLLLFDRVRSKSDGFGKPLHVDLAPLQRSLGFSRAEVLHRSDAALVLRLSTYGLPSTALVRRENNVLELECEDPGKTPVEHLEGARALYRLDQEMIDPVLAAAHEMIRRRLPFDEPKTEEGQQDGLLRIHFRKAYRSYRRTYEFNGDSYYVFDGHGQPRLPQVCIDFITDAFDWGTGGYWPHRDEKRERRKGALDFSSMGIENPRSIESLANFATQTPEWFDMAWLPESEQVKFLYRSKFFEALARDADKYRRGDVVFIFGLRDDEKFHFHSFLVDEKDPVTGIPTVLLANAGPPQARSWEGEMQNAPLRKIVARMRVRREILQLAQRQALASPGVPLRPPEKPEPQGEPGEASESSSPVEVTGSSG